MKTKLQILSVALLGLALTSCSSSMNMSKSSNSYSDDIYYTPREKVSDLDEIKNYTDQSSSKQDTSKIRIAELENKYSKILASDSTNIDTTIYKADYETNFENRLNFRRSCYGISEYSLTYSDDLRWVLLAYPPSLYNIVVMNDQIWAEPKYSASSWFWPHSYFNIGISFGNGFWNVSPWFYSSYNYPYYGYSNLYVLNPYYWGNYYYTNVNYNYGNYYYGPRSGNLTTSYNSSRFRDNSIENQIISSRRRGDITNRGNSGITSTRTDQGGRNQEVITRGTRSNDYTTTRLRGNSGTTRNTNLTETTRRNNNNNTYQTPRSTNNDGYIRTGTRNQNPGNNSNTRSTNTSVRDRESVNRNTSPTYNRPSRVDVSSSRERTTNSTNSTSTRQRESTYSSPSSSGNSSGTRSSSSSNTSTNTNNTNTSGSNNRRR